MRTDEVELRRRIGGMSRKDYQRMLLGLMHAAVKLEETAKRAAEDGAVFAEMVRADCEAVLAAYKLLKDLDSEGRIRRIM